MCNPSSPAVALFVAMTACIAYNVHTRIPLPFIDEFFHLRQAQVYCAGDFSVWDPKITTPPGLYIIGTVWARLLNTLGVSRPCGATALRALNLFGGTAVLLWILSFANATAAAFWNINILALPLVYPYLFLFYTDVWSTVFVVAAVVAVWVQPNAKGAILCNLAGFCSLWFRQTNIVWIAFAAVVLVEQRMRARGESEVHTIPPSDPKPLAKSDSQLAELEELDRVKYYDFVRSTACSIVSTVIKFLRASLYDWYLLVPFLINFGLFATFIVFNGGITFGDKENHQISIHGAQLLYCSAFLAFFSAPLWISPQTVVQYLEFTMSHIVTTLVSLWAINYTIVHFTIVHPFLLADNRHYTFYIFRKIISRRNANYVMVPAYHFATWVVFHLLTTANKYTASSATPGVISQKEKHATETGGVAPKSSSLVLGSVGIFAWAVACVLTLVPSPLFEPRYYILPLVTLRLFTQSKRHIWEFAWYMGINAVVFYVFFSYEFTWATELAPQRIIW